MTLVRISCRGDVPAHRPRATRRAGRYSGRRAPTPRTALDRWSATAPARAGGSSRPGLGRLRDAHRGCALLERSGLISIARMNADSERFRLSSGFVSKTWRECGGPGQAAPRQARTEGLPAGTPGRDRGRATPCAVIRRQLVRSQIELVRFGARRHVVLQHPVLPRRQGQRQRLDDARGKVVLESEEVTERQLRGLRPDERAVRRFDELRAHAKLLAGAQQRAGQHNVDAGFVGDRSQILGAVGESRRDDAGSDDQRSRAPRGSW